MLTRSLTAGLRVLTGEYADAFIDFPGRCHGKANAVNTLKSIVTEEISYW